jgi:hypothetical protein
MNSLAEWGRQLGEAQSELPGGCAGDAIGAVQRRATAGACNAVGEVGEGAERFPGFRRQRPCAGYSWRRRPRTSAALQPWFNGHCVRRSDRRHGFQAHRLFPMRWLVRTSPRLVRTSPRLVPLPAASYRHHVTRNNLSHVDLVWSSARGQCQGHHPCVPPERCKSSRQPTRQVPD